jgi:ribose 5-phosphate isomerase B
MAANKVPGVRAAPAHDRFTAEVSRAHNDANVLCLGARVLDRKHVLELAEHWLSVPFEGGRHARRVAQLDELDRAR